MKKYTVRRILTSLFTLLVILLVLGSDYMMLAESKGISGSALIFRHALRNALIPIITVLAPLIVDLMTGSRRDRAAVCL